MLANQLFAMKFDSAFEQTMDGGVADTIEDGMFERLACCPFEDRAAIEGEHSFFGRIGLNVVVP